MPKRRKILRFIWGCKGFDREREAEAAGSGRATTIKGSKKIANNNKLAVAA